MSNKITKESIEKQAHKAAENQANRHHATVLMWREDVESNGVAHMIEMARLTVRDEYRAKALNGMLRHADEEGMEPAVAYLRARMTEDLLSNRHRHNSTDPFTCAVAEATREAKSDLLNSDLPQIEAILALKDQVEEDNPCEPCEALKPDQDCRYLDSCEVRKPRMAQAVKE